MILDKNSACMTNIEFPHISVSAYSFTLSFHTSSFMYVLYYQNIPDILQKTTRKTRWYRYRKRSSRLPLCTSGGGIYSYMLLRWNNRRVTRFTDLVKRYLDDVCTMSHVSLLILSVTHFIVVTFSVTYFTVDLFIVSHVSLMILSVSPISLLTYLYCHVSLLILSVSRI